MKKLLCAVLMLCLCMPALTESMETTFIFRNGIQFGMSIDDVKELEDSLNQDKYYCSAANLTTIEQTGQKCLMVLQGLGAYCTVSATAYVFSADETGQDEVLTDIYWECIDASAAAELYRAGNQPLSGNSMVQPLFSDKTALKDYEQIEQILTPKYGHGMESDRILSGYMQDTIKEYNIDDANKLVSHRLLRTDKGLILIEHGLVPNMTTEDTSANYVHYFLITEEEYTRRMQANAVGEYLNQML